MEPSKIVARYCDGRTLKGTTQNFFPNKPVFHVNRHGGSGPGDVIEVRVAGVGGLSNPVAAEPGGRVTP